MSRRKYGTPQIVSRFAKNETSRGTLDAVNAILIPPNTDYLRELPIDNFTPSGSTEWKSLMISFKAAVEAPEVEFSALFFCGLCAYDAPFSRRHWLRNGSAMCVGIFSGDGNNPPAASGWTPDYDNVGLTDPSGSVVSYEFTTWPIVLNGQTGYLGSGTTTFRMSKYGVEYDAGYVSESISGYGWTSCHMNIDKDSQGVAFGQAYGTHSLQWNSMTGPGGNPTTVTMNTIRKTQINFPSNFYRYMANQVLPGGVGGYTDMQDAVRDFWTDSEVIEFNAGAQQQVSNHGYASQTDANIDEATYGPLNWAHIYWETTGSKRGDYEDINLLVRDFMVLKYNRYYVGD